MKKNYGLTNTEMQIMELLWRSKEAMTFKEILVVAAEEWGKNWKIQTLSTYLTGLQKMGLVESERKGCSNAYRPICTKDEHIHRWTKKMVEACFDNSISRLVVAFTGGEKLSEKDAEELRKLL